MQTVLLDLPYNIHWQLYYNDEPMNPSFERLIISVHHSFYFATLKSTSQEELSNFLYIFVIMAQLPTCTWLWEGDNEILSANIWDAKPH